MINRHFDAPAQGWMAIFRVDIWHGVVFMTRSRVPVGVLVLLIATVSVAHHSGAMFDDQKVTTVAGTVRNFQWTNPHCWIQLLVSDQGTTTEWSIEMGSPAQLFRGGWRLDSLKSGDRITVDLHPMRDGSNGGLYVSAMRADGKPISAPVN
jgi:hypothetical protein